MSSSESSRHRVPPYKRPLIVGGFLAILAIVIIVTVLVCKNFLNSEDNSHVNNPDQRPDTSTPSNPEDNQDEPKPEEDKPEDKAPPYEGEDVNNLEELTGNIIYKDIDTENQVLHSAVNINQYLSTDGQCVYNLKRGDAILRTASAPATADVTTSVCGPFDISVADLTSGNYTIEVIITGDGKRGVITDTLDI